MCITGRSYARSRQLTVLPTVRFSPATSVEFIAAANSAAISAAHVWRQLAHAHVITVRLLTITRQPSEWHFGHSIGRGLFVLGTATSSDLDGAV